MSERARLTAVTGLAKASIPEPPPRTKSAATSSPGPRPVDETPRATAPDEPSTTKADRRARSAKSEGGKRPIVFTLPDQIEARFRAAARASADESLADLLLSAVETNVDRLSELVVAEQARTAPLEPEASSIFPVPEARRTNRSKPHRRVTIPLRIANVDVIDRLVKAHRADSRSQLLTAALRAVYGQPGDD